MSFYSIPPEWRGETCFILGGGPSLRGFDAECLRGRRVIVVNNSYLLAPWADVLYFCDLSWWRQPWKRGETKTHREKVAEMFSGRVISLGTGVNDVLRLRNSGQRGLETADPAAIRHGTNSGYQAMNVAYHFGAKRIVLLGYDLHVGGGAHWHEGHWHTKPVEQFARELTRMVKYFELLVEPLKVAGVEVLNATPGSALKCWQQCSVAEVLEGKRVAA
jgi:hypothetical protein